MLRPERLFEQYSGKAFAEVTRGCGVWPLQPHPVDLEPPWEPFDRRSLTKWDCYINNWEAPWEGNWFKKQLGSGDKVLDSDHPIILPRSQHVGCGNLTAVVIEQFHEDRTTIPRAEQFLRTLSNLHHPVSFELIGVGAQPLLDQEYTMKIVAERQAGSNRKIEVRQIGWIDPYVISQFVAHPIDAKRIERQLLGHYPNSAVVAVPGDKTAHIGDLLTDVRGGTGYAGTLALSSAHCLPLRIFTRLDPDPLGVAISAMDHLGRREWALLQILFQPTRYPWDSTLEEAITDPYKGDFLLPDVNHGMLREKFRSPLFAVSVRIMAKRESVYRHLQGWARQFARSPQSFDSLLEEGEAELLWDAVCERCAYRPGVLLNSDELASLVHLPSESVVSDRLRRVKSRTRPAVPAKAKRGVVVLGENVHQGKRRLARIPAELRKQHCYLAGASGTGKSTLLLNMILQDIANGEGVALLDPHGDLVTDVLKRIPAHRVDDVILFDPADREFPFALNILEAKDARERERIVAETLMALERYFPASWGPRLQKILEFTLYTILEAIPGATLADVERMLIDHRFREFVVQKTTNARYVTFWDVEFERYPKNAVDPVLNKVSVFLLNATVRNIICQRHSTVDFDALINTGKIFLANLSTGILTERLSGMFGSFLTTKIINAAFRRASIPQEQRRPFYLYVDEFQAFMNLSVGFDRILNEARKYRLVLAGMANQYVGQLSQSVRQAVFGNTGTLIAFRLGVDDAGILAKELGDFTAAEILNLKRGQAIVRAEVMSQTFNVATYPPPPPEPVDPTPTIVANARARFARPLSQVDAELHPQWGPTAERPFTPPSTGKPQSSNKKSQGKQKPSRPKQPGKKTQPPPPPPNDHSDPSEDDLVS